MHCKWAGLSSVCHVAVKSETLLFFRNVCHISGDPAVNKKSRGFIFFSGNSGNRSCARIFRISFLSLKSFKKTQQGWELLILAFPEKSLKSTVNRRHAFWGWWSGSQSDAGPLPFNKKKCMKISQLDMSDMICAKRRSFYFSCTNQLHSVKYEKQ